MVFLFQRRSNAPAVVMTAAYDVIDLQDPHSVLKGAHQVKVCVDDQVGNVPHHKYRSGILPHDFIGRNASIGTT